MESSPVRYFSRKLWHILKIAQILAVDTSSELLITPDHIQNALGLVTSLESNMRQAFGAVGANDKAGALNTLWDSIRLKKTLTKQELTKLNWRNADGKTTDEHLRTLLDLKRIAVRLSGGVVHYDILDPSSLLY